MYYEIVGMNTRILGALHVFPASATSMPPWALDAFQNSDSIEMEHDRAALEACFLDSHTGMLKPWAQLFNKLGHILSRAPIQPGVEAIFSLWLTSRGRPPMTYIETGPAFADLLEMVPPNDLAIASNVMDQSALVLVENIAALHRAWEQCDFDALVKLQATSPLGSVPSLRQAVFVARNENWGSIIAARGASEKRHLLVVGALHLVGPDNLLDQLAARGMPVRMLAQ